MPEFTPTAQIDYMWSENVDGEKFTRQVGRIFDEAAFWRQNLFNIPSGSSGKAYINAQACLWEAITPGGALEHIALKALGIMDHLILQKPHAKSRSKDHAACIKRRLAMWKEGRLYELTEEVRAIQERLKERKHKLSDDELARRFAGFIFTGKINAAMRLLDEEAAKGGIQKLTPTVIKILENLHPEAKPAETSALIQGTPPTVHAIIFDELDGERILDAARRTRGAAGMSGGDADLWKRKCDSFGDASTNLCNAMARVAQRMATEYMDPNVLEALLCNRLVPLDKNPGTRPVGIGEVPRRIIGKAVLSVIKPDIMKAAGATQMCAGQKGGIEAIIHSMIELFADDETDAILLVDATNAFNTINRAVALHNIRHICPPLSTFLINVYRKPARLFVAGGLELESREGTTQGCPAAMAMYALAVTPLIDQLRPEKQEAKRKLIQAWYADDSQAADNLCAIKKWWDALIAAGPGYGYYPNPKKCHLIVKPHMLAEAKKIFEGTGVNVVRGGKRDLGAAIGSAEFVKSFLQQKVDAWVGQVEVLSRIAQCKPHAAHAGFIHGLKSKWIFSQRTMQCLQSHIAPLERVIRFKFLPALTGEKFMSDDERELYALPARWGGLAIANPVQDSLKVFNDSMLYTEQLQALILSSSKELVIDEEKQADIIKNIRAGREKSHSDIFDKLYAKASPMNQKLMLLAKEKGASCLFTVLPLEKFDLAFKSKRDFRDLVRLRYGKPIHGLPDHCSCGAQYSLDHSQQCKTGGFIHMRHDSARDIFAASCAQVFKDVEVEPLLEPLSGEVMKLKSANTSDNARADVRVNGFWGKRRNAFFDVRIFYPMANSLKSQTLDTLYKKFAKSKKREYAQRLNEVNDADFTPLIMSSTGGMGAELQIALKHLARKIADKQGNVYSKVAGFLQCRFVFALMRSALVCLRGSRSPWKRIEENPMASVDLACIELGL